MSELRLDFLMVQKGLVSGREKAKYLIQNGQVLVDGKEVKKPSAKYSDLAEISIVGDQLPYVSRGGLKLEKALQVFSISLQDKVCMDVGASTGGFTDCMLQYGASKVYAVDVGKGQLHETLRKSRQVVVMEEQNIRTLTAGSLSDSIDFISVDVSFISLTLVLPVLYQLLQEQGEVVCLIKPQFEVGPGKVGKKGVVKDKKIHEFVVKEICSFAESIGFSLQGLSFSPVKGPEGNIEYLLYGRKSAELSKITGKEQTSVVQCSHNSL